MFVIVIGDDLFGIYTDANTCKRAWSDWIHDVERLRVIVRSSIAHENIYLSKDQKVFAKEMKLEKTDVKRCLRNLVTAKKWLQSS